MPQRIAVVTTTQYQSIEDIRFKLAAKTMRDVYRYTGQRPIVVDGSPEKIREQLQRAGGSIFEQYPDSTTMGATRRQAIEIAMLQQAEVIVWMEPEKCTLTRYIPELVKRLMLAEASILIPRRQSLDSYPPYQAVKELEGNSAVAEFTSRPDLDLWFGPRVFDRRGAKYFLDYQGENGDRWESIFIPVLQALKAGEKVASHTVDYIHPPEQTAAETDPVMDRKRDDQLVSLLSAMKSYWMA